jgi:hypothetical protein
LCYNKSMPDEAPSRDVAKEPIREVSQSEPINPPASPDNPSAQAANPVSAQSNYGKIEELKDELRAAEKWMIWLTAAIAFFALCTIGVGLLQWDVMKGQLSEMRSGSSDTHELAEAAKKQAAASVQQVGSFAALAIVAKEQSDNTATLAKAASDQVTKLQAGVDETHKLALAAEDANTNAKEAIEAQTRPWLGIEGGLQSISTNVSEPSISVSFEFALRNYGQSPAIKVSSAFEFSLPYKYLRAGTAQTAACERAGKTSSTVDRPDFFPSIILASIFPGDSGVSTIHQSASFNLPDPKQPFTPDVIVGCIVYQGSKDGKLRHTRVMYTVSSRDPENRARITGLRLAGTSTD